MRDAIITSKEIGQSIKRRRKELGISQERLAEVLDVSYQQVQRYENGTNKLNVEYIQAIAQALSVSTTYFLENRPESCVPPSSEEKTLIELFSRIADPDNRRIVLAVARLAVQRK